MTLDDLWIDVKAGRSLNLDNPATDTQTGKTQLGTVKAKTLDVVIASLAHPLERRSTLQDLRRTLGKTAYEQMSKQIPKIKSKRVTLRPDIEANEVNMLVYGLRETRNGYAADSSLVFIDNRGETETFRREREFRREDLYILPEYAEMIKKVPAEGRTRMRILNDNLLKYVAIFSALGAALTLGAILIDRCSKEARADEPANQVAPRQEIPTYEPPVLTERECLKLGMVSSEQCDYTNAAFIEWIYNNREKICRNPKSFGDIKKAVEEGRLQELISAPLPPILALKPKTPKPSSKKSKVLEECSTGKEIGPVYRFINAYATTFDAVKKDYMNGERRFYDLLDDDSKPGEIVFDYEINNEGKLGAFSYKAPNIKPEEMTKMEETMRNYKFDKRNCKGRGRLVFPHKKR